MSELKPCPFCGSTDIVYVENWVGDNVYYNLECRKCCMELWPMHAYKDRAAQHWNDSVDQIQQKKIWLKEREVEE